MPTNHAGAQLFTQITIVETEPDKQADALLLMSERAASWRDSPDLFRSVCIAARMDDARSRDLLQSAHKASEFRTEWDHFAQTRST